jgi:glycosyltransferase involved in cell wall biosynthesis
MKQFLKNKDVILLASSNYHTYGKSKLNCHFIAEEFAKKGTKVLFVESLGLKDISIYGKSDIYKAFKRVFDFLHLLIFGPIKPQANLYIISLIKLPFDKLNFIHKLNEIIVSSFIRRYSKKYLSKKPLIWTFLPNLYFTKTKIANSGFVYHNVDDFSAVPNVDKSYIVRSERQTLRIADIVFTVSSHRVKDLSEFSKNPVIYLNNVADFELFHKAYTEDISTPTELVPILKKSLPIIGYIGNLAAYKEDINLVSKIVENCPEYSFIFIGAIGEGEFLTNISKLKNLKNAYFLGSRDHKEIYKYLKFFDVGIIPRRKNSAGEGGFPMKYFEYLAAGLPTVVTGVGNLASFTKLGRLGGIANTPDQFKEKFEYWINQKKNSPVEYEKAIKERIKIAKLNSWSNRIEQLNNLATTIIKA